MKQIYKKILSIIVFVGFVSVAYADKFEVNGLYYEIDASNSEVAIVTSSPSGYYQEASYNIPGTITYADKELRVEKIGNRAFYFCSKLEKITLPNSITEIEDRAFYACSKLQSITLPSSLLSIGDKAFEGCTVLNSLIIPQNVNTIGSEFITGCDSLATLQVESGNAYYYSGGNCNAIIETATKTLIAGCKNSIIPGSVEYIGSYAFASNKGVTLISIPNSVKGIKDHAFYFCSKLEKITLPNSITEIEDRAFYACSKLQSITLPSSLLSIGDKAFEGCTVLNSLIIPQNVKTIGSNFITGCDSLATLQVESGNAYYYSGGNCNAIIETATKTLIAGCKNSIIPESVEYIGSYAFASNKGVTSISIPGSVKGIKDHAFYYCSKLEKITLPNSITEIGDYAFYECSKLQSITLPSSLLSIGDKAFNQCSNLIEVVSCIENPFIIDDNVFYDYSNAIYSTAILYVPKDKISTYKSVNGWKNFVNIQEIQPDPTVNIEGLTYAIKTRLGYAIITQSSPDILHAKILSTISYDNVDYPVAEIEEGAFANSVSLVSVTIPNSINIIGQSVLMNCDHLAAIDWQCKNKPSTEFVSNIKNPNLLFYVSSYDTKPNGVRNVIVDGVAENIILSDEDYGEFYCIKEFVANNISYTHSYSLKTELGVSQGWESIALPFDVETYMTSKGEVKPYKIASSGERVFWLRELTSSGMVETDGIKANVPYIISMPNWEGYQDYYNIEGNVVFSAQEVVIKETDIKAIDFVPRHFWPSYQNIERVQNCFALNKQHLIPSDTYHGPEILPGSTFIGNLREIKPFEAYFTYDGASSTRVITISELIDGTTSVSSIKMDNTINATGSTITIDSPTDSSLSIYSATGQLVKMVMLSRGYNEIGGLLPGLYIINGKKVLVR